MIIFMLMPLVSDTLDEVPVSLKKCVGSAITTSAMAGVAAVFNKLARSDDDAVIESVEEEAQFSRRG